jgi:MoxR-like ATPase
VTTDATTTGEPRPVLDRAREVELLVAALDGGAHVLLEGPPGTGKSTLLRSVATDRSAPFHLVEGNAELTPARLVGHFDPAQVMARGYDPDVFVDGPLVAALRSGGLLYVEEINRVPEETLNVLITVMSESELNVPRLGPVHAERGFRLVAAMNPFDAVGTERISSAIYDRTCRISMDYQSAQTESDIVALRADGDGHGDPRWRSQVVELVRRTRSHPDVRIGSSVRGAIDLVAIASRLAVMRSVPADDWQAGLDAALVSLSGRIRLQESAAHRPEEIVRALYESVFGPPPDADRGTPPEEGGPGEA